MNMRKKEYLSLPISKGALHILRWGLFFIYAALLGVFHAICLDAPLHVAKMHYYGNALEILLCSLVLLTFGTVTADLALRDFSTRRS